MLKMCSTPSDNTQAGVIVLSRSGNVWLQNSNPKDHYFAILQICKANCLQNPVFILSIGLKMFWTEKSTRLSYL
jgi:hypothetical protein